MTKAQHNWKISSSSLRMLLRHYQWSNREFSSIEQFQWIEMNLGVQTYYLYNTRSRCILASVRLVNNSYYIRYRKHSRYAGILSSWAERLAKNNSDTRIVASNRLSRWERRVNRNSGHPASRYSELYGYIYRLYSRGNLPLPSHLTDKLNPNSPAITNPSIGAQNELNRRIQYSGLDRVTMSTWYQLP